MVVVMAIVALLASFALPKPSLRTSRIGLEQLAMRTAALMQADRYAAIRRHETVATTADVRARVIRSGSSGRDIRTPEDIDVRATVTGDCQARAGVARFEFYPDGRACGGTLAFVGAGAGFETRVNWLTGGVEVVALSSR